jgi:hypothetical protein
MVTSATGAAVETRAATPASACSTTRAPHATQGCPTAAPHRPPQAVDNPSLPQSDAVEPAPIASRPGTQSSFETVQVSGIAWEHAESGTSNAEGEAQGTERCSGAESDAVPASKPSTMQFLYSEEGEATPSLVDSSISECTMTSGFLGALSNDGAQGERPRPVAPVAAQGRTESSRAAQSASSGAESVTGSGGNSAARTAVGSAWKKPLGSSSVKHTQLRLANSAGSITSSPRSGGVMLMPMSAESRQLLTQGLGNGGAVGRGTRSRGVAVPSGVAPTSVCSDGSAGLSAELRPHDRSAASSISGGRRVRRGGGHNSHQCTDGSALDLTAFPALSDTLSPRASPVAASAELSQASTSGGIAVTPRSAGTSAVAPCTAARSGVAARRGDEGSMATGGAVWGRMATRRLPGSARSTESSTGGGVMTGYLGWAPPPPPGAAEGQCSGGRGGGRATRGDDMRRGR